MVSLTDHVKNNVVQAVTTPKQSKENFFVYIERGKNIKWLTLIIVKDGKSPQALITKEGCNTTNNKTTYPNNGRPSISGSSYNTCTSFAY